MKLLFATVPFDGHFNPLTSAARRLLDQGHDVRWYAGPSYAGKLAKLGIPHLPYQRAREVNAENVGQLFPERQKFSGPTQIRFDLTQIFVAPSLDWFEDLRELRASFPFEAVLCDGAFFGGAHLVKQKLGVPVAAFGISPLLCTSPGVPPNFAGLKPPKSALGRGFQRLIGFAMDQLVMKEGRERYQRILDAQALPRLTRSLFDIIYDDSDAFFQLGAPGFEWPRRELPKSVRFIGALLPWQGTISRPFPHRERLEQASRVILISQGTVDNKDPHKLIIPALEGLEGSGALLIATTGGENTAALRQRFPQAIIEDWVDFPAVLSKASLFVCNGGFGSILMSFTHGVPVLTAGIREGKNDINARVDHFGYGIDLRTEQPKSARIRAAAEKLLATPRYRENVARLRAELAHYQPLEAVSRWVDSLA